MAKRVGTPPEIARDAVAVLHERDDRRRPRHNLAEIAKTLGITRQAIAGWRAVPAEWVRPVSEVTGIPAWRLRPDLYDAPPAETTDAAG